VSKILRIKKGTNGRKGLKAVVGYLASPGGLNGEAHMKEWIIETATPHVFDLVREEALFQEYAVRALQEIDVQHSLDLG